MLNKLLRPLHLDYYRNMNNTFEYIAIQDFTDESVHIIKWTSWKSPILIMLLMIIGALGIGGKSLIINYVTRFAPKQRAINTFILFDQVST